MDSPLAVQDRYIYTPIGARETYRWPNGTSLAVYVAVNVEAFAYGGYGPTLTPGSDPPNAEHRRYGWREYGNRIGIWRLMEEFAAHEIPAAYLLNAYVPVMYPQLGEAIAAASGEVVGHGRTNSESHGGMSREDERALIEESTELLAKHIGVRPRGWMSPGACQSPNTLDLLKELGYAYSLDWPIDDQPVWLRTDGGPLLNVPYAFEANDYPTILSRGHTASMHAEIALDTFDEQLEQSAKQPLVYSLSLHTFIAGQPHRLRQIRRVLDRIAEKRDQLWITTPGAIADHVAPLLPVPDFVPAAAQHPEAADG